MSWALNPVLNMQRDVSLLDSGYCSASLDNSIVSPTVYRCSPECYNPVDFKVIMIKLWERTTCIQIRFFQNPTPLPNPYTTR